MRLLPTAAIRAHDCLAGSPVRIARTVPLLREQHRFSQCRLRSRDVYCRHDVSVTNSSTIHSEDSGSVENIPEVVTGDIFTGEDETETAEDEKPLSWWGRLRKRLVSDKARLQNLGIGAFLAYGFISNVTYGVCFVIAWLTHVKRTGMIPFARGQWPAFLGVYAGLWALQNVIRPLRLAAALAMTPFVNRMLLYLVEKLGIKRRQAVLLLFIGLAIFSMSSLVTAIWVLGGIPTRPPPASV